MKKLILDGNSLTIENVYCCSVAPSQLSFSSGAVRKMKQSRALVEEWVKGDETIYGVTTGFGEFSNVRINKKDTEALQENLIMSHSAGIGDPLPAEIVCAMIILRLNALAKGYSGVRIETVDFLKKIFN